MTRRQKRTLAGSSVSHIVLREVPYKQEFPIIVRDQSVVVKIYRMESTTTATGYAYAVAWVGPDGREKVNRASLESAREFAELKARQLARGIADGLQVQRSDLFELSEARAATERMGLPLLSALAELEKARGLVGGSVLPACEAWAERRVSKVVRILAPAAVEKFIAAKEALGKQGRTYESKLKPIKTFFAGRYLDSIRSEDWTRYLGQFADPVTRNDFRKRATTLCRWARAAGHLPRDQVPEIEQTERAKERANPIGILTPEAFGRVLAFLRSDHPDLLAAVVLAGFCGVRSDEIQGKRGDRERRQRWEDIHLDRGFMSVTAAKENTPSSRIIHLSDAAKAWLQVCPGEKTGPVCDPGALEYARRVVIEKKIPLPENCFRHSWISYRIALTGDKAATATEAGNSVKEIDRRYRVPLPKFKGEAWFSLRP